jgi:thymidylate synthase
MPYDDTSYYADLNENSQRSDGRTRSPNHVDRQFQDHLQIILDEGHESDDRTGTGTLKYFGRQMRFDLQEGFPLLTTKAVPFPLVVRECLWMLRGQTNIKHLVEKGCGIWTENAHARFKEETGADLTRQEFEQKIFDSELKPYQSSPSFAGQWGEMGHVYGRMWRSWPVIGRLDGTGRPYKIDQFENLIDQLQNNPDSRRLKVEAWNPQYHTPAGDEAPGDAVLPPCHTGFQCFTRERPDGQRGLSLLFKMRSSDAFLGLPFDIARYALITHMLAKKVGMVPEELIFQGGDCHLYKNHLDQAKEQIGRVARPELPTLSLRRDSVEDLGDYRPEDISLEGYDPHPAINAPLAT